MWFYPLTVSKFSCLAKSYSVSGLTPLPRIPNQLNFIQKSAHEVLEADLEARVMAVFYMKSFVFSSCDGIFVLLPALSMCSPSVIHWISKLFIDSIHILFLLYLLLWFCFPTPKTCRISSPLLGH